MANSSYIQGETIAFTLDDASYSAVSVKVGATSHTLAKSGTVWSVSIDSTTLCGQYRWAIFADGKAVATGAFYVKPLVSKYRAVVTAIDVALQGVATNGKYSITVGEIALTDKTFAEMSAMRNYYERMANADEEGVAPNHGPMRITEIYT